MPSIAGNFKLAHYPPILVRNGKFRIEKELGSPMRVPEEVLKCVGFIGEVTHTDAVGNISGDLHATGFFVAIPASSPKLLNSWTIYFVTAKHVAQDLKDKVVYFLVNRIGGGVTSIKGVYGGHWWFHPDDPAADLALIPIHSQPDADIKAVHFDNLGTKENLAKLDVGIGDEIYATGLFTPAGGIDRNLPIVRHGNIAMMPQEQIQTELGYADVYLVEARSLGGLSGSPVFVRPTISIPLPENSYGLKHSFCYGHGATLLGLMHGHWDIKESEINKPFFTHDRQRGVNYGVAIVVPAYKISETLNRPELVEQRKKAEESAIQGTVPSMDSN